MIDCYRSLVPQCCNILVVNHSLATLVWTTLDRDCDLFLLAAEIGVRVAIAESGPLPRSSRPGEVERVYHGYKHVTPA